MKKLTLLLLLLCFSNILFAQTFAGVWSGSLSVQGAKLPLVFHVIQTPGGYNSTMDSPAQNALGLPTNKTTVNDNEITIDVSAMGITYSGKYLPDSSKIIGIFKQGGLQLPLHLVKRTAPSTAAKENKRPQDPKDYPYKQEEVTFKNSKGGNVLAGTLTMPSDTKVTKIAILISGSGPQNRDEELFNHRPFLVWSDWLTRNGIAVLRYDDRGVGKSTGNFQNATTADFATDAEAAVTYLLGRPDLRGAEVGLIGHSEGGMIASIIASRDPAIKFMVLLAGPGAPVSELMLQQVKDQLRLQKAPEQEIKSYTAISRQIFSGAAPYKNLNATQYKVKMRPIVKAAFKKNRPELKAHELNAATEARLAAEVSPWYRYFIRFNPADYLTKVKCHVLAINGSLDSQVSSETNLKAIKTNVLKGGNQRVEVLSMPGLNHMFQKAETGAVSEYGTIEETVNPAALQKVTNWLKAQ